MKNLHPNNIFINQDNNIIITDVGFVDIPGISTNVGLQSKFTAPELRIQQSQTITEIADRHSGMADIWSLGKLVMLLAFGTVEIDL